MFLESVKAVYGSIFIFTTPALPVACFRCSAIAASISESVVLGLHLFKASEGREYEYLKKEEKKAKKKQLILKMSLWSYN